MEREPITKQITAITQSSQAIAQTFTQMFRPQPLKKREIHHLKSEHSRSIFFIQSGLLHLYDDQPSQPQTIGIYRPGDFFIALGKLGSSHPPELQLQALQPSSFCMAESRQIEKLLQARPGNTSLYHYILQNYIETIMTHLQLLQAPKAVQRYQLMRQHFGTYLLQIPYQIQASYMGISRKHLSRIIQHPYASR